MTAAIDAAVIDVRLELAKQAAWMTPEGEKRFDPVGVVEAFATALLTAYLAGFTGEATKIAKESGQRTARYLEAQFKRLFAGQTEVVAEDIAQLAEKAPTIAAELSAGDISTYATHAETSVRPFLAAHMPANRADRLTAKIREAAVKHVLKG